LVFLKKIFSLVVFFIKTKPNKKKSSLPKIEYIKFDGKGIFGEAGQQISI
jgi:hypothetical protein